MVGGKQELIQDQRLAEWAIAISLHVTGILDIWKYDYSMNVNSISRSKNSMYITGYGLDREIQGLPVFPVL